MPLLNLLDPKNVATLTAEDLANDGTLLQLQVVADEYLKGGDVGDAQATVRNLLAVLNQHRSLQANPELWERCQTLVVQLQWTCLPVLADEEIEKLFRQHLKFAFEREVEIEVKLGGYFRIHKDVETLGFRRLLVLRAMQENQERIGTGPIVLNNIGEPVASTVQHWLRDYDRFAPAGRSRGVLAQESYFTQSANGKKLPAEPREVLRRLIRLYDFLRFPKLPDDIVEPTGHGIPMKPSAFTLPMARETPQPPPVMDLAHHVTDAYHSVVTSGEDIANDMAWVKETAGTNVTKLSTILQTAVREKNVVRSLAILHSSIELRLFSQVLVSVKDWDGFLSWLGHYRYQQQHSILSSPLNRQSVQMYLQYVLQELLVLTESDAARIGVRLGNLFRQHGYPEMAALAYYDVKEGKFRWLT